MAGNRENPFSEGKRKQTDKREHNKRAGGMLERQEGPAAPAYVSDTYFAIFQNANDGIIIHDTSGRIYEINETMHKRLGYTREEMLEMSLNVLVAPGFTQNIETHTDRLKRDGVAIFESADRRKDGTILPVEVSARLIEYHGQKLIQSVVRDISERKIAEELIAIYLREKELLSLEVQKAIKLNTHTMHYILKKMSFSLRKPKAVLEEMLMHSSSRISMHLSIQDKLFRSPSFIRIELSDVLNSFIAHNYSQHVKGIRNIEIKQEHHGITMDLSRALPCCLIISELLSNALIHAFPDDRKGEVLVKISQDKNERFTIILKDDGVGIPKGLNYRKTTSLGFKLVMDLVKQLQGTISLRRKLGTQVTIRFS